MSSFGNFNKAMMIVMPIMQEVELATKDKTLTWGELFDIITKVGEIVIDQANLRDEICYTQKGK